jgi:hypothetical protein
MTSSNEHLAQSKRLAERVVRHFQFCSATMRRRVVSIVRMRSETAWRPTCAGHVMIEHYSRTHMEAKRAAMDAIVEAGVHQNVHQGPAEEFNPIAKSERPGWT